MSTGVVLDADVQKVEVISYARTLQKVTGKEFGADANKWAQWWKDTGGKP